MAIVPLGSDSVRELVKDEIYRILRTDRDVFVSGILLSMVHWKPSDLYKGMDLKVDVRVCADRDGYIVSAVK